MIAFLGASPIAGVFLIPILYGTTLGTAVGSGAGVVTYALDPKNTSTYQYKVKSLTNAKILTIQQRTVPIPLNAKVRILERNGSVFIRKKIKHLEAHGVWKRLRSLTRSEKVVNCD